MDDSQVWSRLKAGDQAALEEIYTAHIDYLLQYGLRFTQDASLVEDCVHDLFVDLWRKRNSLGSPNSIRAYLLVALRRSILKKVQKKFKQQSDKLPEDLPFAAELAIDQVIIASEVSEESAQALQKAVQELSSRQREVLYLRFYQEVPYEEICEMMGISYQSVRNLVSSAIRALRSLMEFTVFLIMLNNF